MLLDIATVLRAQIEITEGGPAAMTVTARIELTPAALQFSPAPTCATCEG